MFPAVQAVQTPFEPALPIPHAEQPVAPRVWVGSVKPEGPEPASHVAHVAAVVMDVEPE
jgi:hypothetical protein